LRWEIPELSEQDALNTVRESLLRNYFKDPAYLVSEAGQNDLANHLDRRLKSNREQVIPWLESFVGLDGARILEIGCGTGASTVALAERGAEITAIDIREDSIQVAEDRCRAYGQHASFLAMNGADIRRDFANRRFEIILFYAVLEHMTHEERRAAMRDSWEMLEPGAFWIVVETPNRLWYFDSHTALLPFYHWLPDQVAFEYAPFSERPNFREIYLERTPEIELHYMRRGRGISFHEFDLFLGPARGLEVVASLRDYLRSQDARACQAWIQSGDAAYAAHLKRVCSGLHSAFFEPYLDLAIRKPQSARTGV